MLYTQKGSFKELLQALLKNGPLSYFFIRMGQALVLPPLLSY